MTLTAKQEKYATLRAVNGLSEVEAYLLSYAWTGTKRSVVYVKASELEHSGKVSVRIAELTAEIRKATIEADIADLIERKRDATTILRDKANATYRDRLSANRLLGEYEKELGSGSSVAVDLTLHQPDRFAGRSTEAIDWALAMYDRWGVEVVGRALEAFMASREGKALSDGGKT